MLISKLLRAVNSVSLLFLFFVSANAQFSGGNGTQQNPYQISSINGLNNVRDYHDAYFLLVEDLDLKGSVFDSAGSGEHKGWLPLCCDTADTSGFQGNSFSGVFNGNGHEINGLYIDRPETDYIGLFGLIDSAARVCSLSVSEAKISGAHNIGGITGYSKGEIELCSFSGIIADTGHNMGGITGYNDSGSVINSYSAGIIGAGGVISGVNNGEIRDCFSVMRVKEPEGGIVNRCFIDKRCISIPDSMTLFNVRSTQEMMTEETYTDSGWDFNSIWEINEGESYPGLQCLNNRPVAHQLFDTMYINSDIEVTISGSDSEGDDIASFFIMRQPGHGAAELSGSTVTYTPNTDFSGNDEFIYAAVDSKGDTSSPAMVSIRIIPFAGGTGTPEDPFEITKIIMLDSMRHHMDKHFVLNRDLDFSGTPYDSSADSDSIVFKPLGYGGEWIFTGSFNGKGHKISNLYISSSVDYSALIANLDSAVVESLSLIDINLSGGYGTAGIAGETQASIIRECSVTGVISAVSYSGLIAGMNGENSIIEGCSCSGRVDGSIKVGGLAGSNHGVIKKCRSDAPVNDRDTTFDAQNVGGFVGINHDTIIACVKQGNVHGKVPVGGFVGSNMTEGFISGCVSRGNVKGGQQVGGFAGSNDGIIKDCYSNGIVKGSYQTGGFAGWNSSGEIIQCVSVSDTVGPLGPDGGNNSVGGFVGDNRSSIRRCCTRSNLVIGNADIGGFVGANFQEITNSYCVANIKSTNPYEEASYAIGAFSGSSNITNSFYDSSFSNYDSTLGGKPLSTQQMKSIDSFTDTTKAWLASPWDFAGNVNHDDGNDDVWTIDEGNTYPRLIQASINLSYSAGENGSLTGDTAQYLLDESQGTEVTAAPDSGYRFVRWSDGVESASRTDSVVFDISVEAEFEPVTRIVFREDTALYKEEVEIQAVPNPVSLREGMVDIFVSTHRSGARVKVTIYDCLGNTVDMQDRYVNGEGRLRFNWNLKNLKGVTVSSGTYLCSAEIVTERGKRFRVERLFMVTSD